MGWVFRKSFGRGPFRWTLSKRGVGWSVGIPGLRYGVSPTGQRYVSVGIPNTGLYWTKHFGRPVSATPYPVQPTLPPATAQSQPKSPSTPQNQWWRQKGL